MLEQHIKETEDISKEREYTIVQLTPNNELTLYVEYED